MRTMRILAFAFLFAAAGYCQNVGALPASATPAPGAYNHVFALRSPRNNIEYVPTIPSQGGWLNYLDSAYEQAGNGYPLLKPWLGSVTRTMVLPLQVGDTKCEWNVKYALAPGVWTWWILLNPNVADTDKEVTLQSAFTELFTVANGQEQLPDWRLPACMDPGSYGAQFSLGSRELNAAENR